MFTQFAVCVIHKAGSVGPCGFEGQGGAEAAVVCWQESLDSLLWLLSGRPGLGNRYFKIK